MLTQFRPSWPVLTTHKESTKEEGTARPTPKPGRLGSLGKKKRAADPLFPFASAVVALHSLVLSP